MGKCYKGWNTFAKHYSSGWCIYLILPHPRLQVCRPTWCQCIWAKSHPETCEEPLESSHSSSSLLASSLHKCLASGACSATKQVLINPSRCLLFIYSSRSAFKWNLTVFWSRLDHHVRLDRHSRCFPVDFPAALPRESQVPPLPEERRGELLER